MDIITVNIHNKIIKREILNFLQKYNSKDIEFTTNDDLRDLKLIQATRDEKTMSFDEYLENEN